MKSLFMPDFILLKYYNTPTEFICYFILFWNMCFHEKNTRMCNLWRTDLSVSTSWVSECCNLVFMGPQSRAEFLYKEAVWRLQGGSPTPGLTCWQVGNLSNGNTPFYYKGSEEIPDWFREWQECRWWRKYVTRMEENFLPSLAVQCHPRRYLHLGRRIKDRKPKSVLKIKENGPYWV